MQNKRCFIPYLYCIVIAAFSFLGFLPRQHAVAATSPSEVRWLVVPARDLSKEGPEGIETATTNALVQALGTIPSWKVRIHDPNAKTIQTALQQGLLTDAEVETVPDRTAAERVGLIWKADIVLSPVLTRREQTAVLVVNAVSVVGRLVAGPGKRIDLPQTLADATNATAEEIAHTITQGFGEKLAVILEQNPTFIQPEPSTVDAWVTEGKEHQAAGRFREARLAYEAAIKIDPSNLQACRNLGQVLLSLGDTDAARKLVETTLQTNPNDVDLWLLMGDIHLALGNPGRAQGDFQNVLRIQKDNIRAQEGEARARLALGDSTYALRAYEKLVTAAPQSALVRRGYGEALMQNNQLDKALVQLRQAVDLEPTDRLTREALANLFLRRGKLAEGIEELRRLVDKGGPPLSYPEAEYRRVMRYCAEEFNWIADAFDQLLDGYNNDRIDQAKLVSITQILHKRSDNLARLLEHMVAPADYDRSLRYWVLAATLLNQSDFEATRYATGGGIERLQGAQMYRKSAREAANQARVLASSETRIRIESTAER